MTIVEFLMARIAEDETTARAASAESWQDTEGAAPHWRYGSGKVLNDRFGITSDDGDLEAVHGVHMARHDPARVMLECAAKRAIIEQAGREDAVYEKEWQFNDAAVGAAGAMEGVLHSLASVYSDHPDYNPEWR